MIIWLIGLSGAGKTTIGREVWDILKEHQPNTVFLDGDILREVWGDQLGHSVEARGVNAHRISHLCKMLDLQGINVVACVLSIFPEWLAWNRENLTNYTEVFVDTSLERLIEIDDKGLYQRALNGEIDNVVGVDLKFPVPSAPDMVIDNNLREEHPSEIAKKIVRYAIRN